MKSQSIFQRLSSTKWARRGGLLAVLGLVVGTVVSQTTLPPEVLLPAEPLYTERRQNQGKFDITDCP